MMFDDVWWCWMISRWVLMMFNIVFDDLLWLWIMFNDFSWCLMIVDTYLYIYIYVYIMIHICICLRVENRPSVLGMFLYVPWGGVGWGNNVHVLAPSHDVTPRHVHLHVRTYVMLRWRCVTSRRGGVGWGGAITFTYLRTPMMLRQGTFTCTCAHTSCYVEDVSRHAGVGWGGVGWGHNVHVLAHSHDVTPRHVHLHVRTYVMLRWRCVTSRRGGVGWGNNVHVLAHSHDVTPRHVHLHVRTYVMQM